MKNILLALFALVCFASCQQKQNESNVAGTGYAALEPLSVTLFTEKVELFAEFRPFIVGQETAFAAHLNDLKEFKPFTAGSLQVILKNEKYQYENKVDGPSVPGIYRPVITPAEPGVYTLTFIYKNDNLNETIIVDSVKVYQNLSDVPPATINNSGDKIVYLKEQAWKVEFATMKVEPVPFSEVIRTTGEILPAPGDEMIIIANSSGIVTLAGNKTSQGAQVNAGAILFSVKGGDLTDGNTELQFRQAKFAYEKGKADYERSLELVKDNIVSQKEFLEIKARYESEEANYNNLLRNYQSGGQKVISPISGFIKNIFVSEGQFVSAGQTLATVSQNRRLILKAEVSQKYFSKLPHIRNANFISAYDKDAYNVESLNGKLLSYGKSNDASTLFVPVTFSFDNKGEIIPGSLVDVFLKLEPLNEAIAIPLTSLIEEQGLFFVYVQTGGESFVKREVILGGSDGINILVIKGLNPGEYVVTKGAYPIKLASASGVIPAHGHAH
jgi:membrane fusion protein, heavy metal efflux system